jgi:glucokinase
VDRTRHVVPADTGGAETKAAPAAGATVTEAARAGSTSAPTVLWEAVATLAKDLSLLTAPFEPQAAVHDGRMAPAGDQFGQPPLAEVGRLAAFRHRPEVRLAAPDDEAGCLGAALLAIDMLEAR